MSEGWCQRCGRRYANWKLTTIIVHIDTNPKMRWVICSACRVAFEQDIIDWSRQEVVTEEQT